ncbi:Type III restriction enzyme, res subunit [Planctomycetes bacterium Poly30]|uniref:DNA 3'-5' helicase n=1 Tax=Saltatorellus ferox TaxID=2528018 RepID=A0A518ETH4_9BACT|nr:Type III restriction enzyme, res subunit [Planctomycetes bacterium Poly30]
MNPGASPHIPLPTNPLIVQSDRTLMLHTVQASLDDAGRPRRDESGQPVTEEHPLFAEVRDALSKFAELEKSPDYLHTYRITPVSVWNAAAVGVTLEEIADALHRYACVPVPPAVLEEVGQWIGKYGLLRIEASADGPLPFELVSEDPDVLARVLEHKTIRSVLTTATAKKGSERAFLDDLSRGEVKQRLIRIGFPVDDRGGFVDGDPLEIRLRSETRGGAPFGLRDYQEGAAAAFHAGGSVLGGSGVVVLPCGAGKTVTGMAVMSLVGAKTLILTTNTVAVRQWRDELLDKTELTEDEVGEYTGETKDLKPVTVSTYQMLTWRRSKTDDFEHFEVFRKENWGLVVYDEVHLLPAPIFRVTAELQARRRLGLTATLVREDGKEDEVFCLIGPKRYDVPWKVLEGRGFIAEAHCVEVRVAFSDADRRAYAQATSRQQFRLASENAAKIEVVRELVERHRGERTLIIGQYLDQLSSLRTALDAPLLTGRTPNAERERLYSAFRSGEIDLLILSKVGNFAVDLPDASVAIQVSGTFGSRQEEAQRLGRVLRPKADGSAATFYSIVTLSSRDQEFAEKRQLFLTEQGYAYEIVDATDLGATHSSIPTQSGRRRTSAGDSQ